MPFRTEGSDTGFSLRRDSLVPQRWTAALCPLPTGLGSSLEPPAIQDHISVREKHQDHLPPPAWARGSGLQGSPDLTFRPSSGLLAAPQTPVPGTMALALPAPTPRSVSSLFEIRSLGPFLKPLVAAMDQVLGPQPHIKVLPGLHRCPLGHTGPPCLPHSASTRLPSSLTFLLPPLCSHPFQSLL